MVDEEPEEELTVEQLEEKAKGGDARAQTRVSESTCPDQEFVLLPVLLAFQAIRAHLNKDRVCMLVKITSHQL